MRAGGLPGFGHALPLGPPEQEEIRPGVDDGAAPVLRVFELADHLDHTVRQCAPDE
jgi:hypothetical protein